MRRPRMLGAAALAAALALGVMPAVQASAAPAAGSVPTAAHPLPAAAEHLRVPPNHPAATSGGNPATAHRPGTANPAEVSNNWSGYAVTGAPGTFTSVSSNWVQPRNDYSVAGYAASWVGLDGFGSPSVEQIGTTVASINGQPYYYAWYEMFPAAEVRFSDPLEPGDNVTASVTYANGVYSFYLRDLTEGWVEIRTAVGTQQNASAEVIMEAPADSSLHQLPLTQFGYVDFFGNSVNGHALNAADPNTWTLTMNDPNGGGIATPGATDAQGNFAVTYGAANTFSGHPRIIHNLPASVGSYIHLTTPSPAGGTANTSYLGQAAFSDPVVTSLPGGGFEAAYEGSIPVGPRLMVAGTSFTFNTQLGMALGTRPAIAASSTGAWEVAFQADNGQLYTFTPQTGGVPVGYAMAAHTSPSITAMPGGGFEIAFQGSDGNLWQVGDAGNTNTGLAMAGGTSPAIAAPTSGGTVVAFQDRAGYYCDMNLIIGVCPNTRPMASGTSPGIAALSSGGYEAVFQANTGLLWEVGTYYNFNTQLGMKGGTSPSITAAPDTVFEVAFQANTGVLWLQDLARGGRPQGIAATGSPSIAY